MEGEAEEVGGKVEEKVLRVVTHRIEDLTTAVPVARVVQCYKCREKCVLTVATLRAIMAKTKKYAVICSRCAARDEEFQKEAKYEPFTPEQLSEQADIANIGNIKRGFGG